MSTRDSSNSVDVPTMADVKKAIKEAIEEHAASRNHPYATMEDKGLVTLSNETDSDSEITVATSKAVKKAYDLAKNAVPDNRKINDKPLTNDIILDSKDVNALNDVTVFGYVPGSEYSGVFSVSSSANGYAKGINFGLLDYDTGQIYIRSSGDLYAYYFINGGEGHKGGRRVGGKIWSEINTTTDNNGCIKKLTPTVLIYSNGKYTTNKKSESVIVERLSKGTYLIKGVMGLMNDEAVGCVEIPRCQNDLPMIWINHEILPDGSIKLMTYHREHSDAPTFARNIREGYVDGDLIDIPEGRFVSVRIQMPDVQESQS
ncbi:phage tail protein [Xenorhabdus santafensis]|uniref:phage tail protein n=1 Tax=Xenorhabdus santafensis TaxID=2582833 RepID=UPI0029E7DA96|nr:phage tail protein [Xenorhabdus sp. 12]